MRAAPFLPGLLLAAALMAGCSPRSGGVPAPQGNGGSGAGLVMHGMEMTEVRPTGVRYRLGAERATYALSDKTVEATGVNFALIEKAGEVRVAAPRVAWNIERQTAAFPEGCDAEYPGGYSARVPSAELDLDGRVFRAAGPATFTGPGFTVAGTDLVWHWREGKADLKNPKSVVLPDSARRKRG